MNTNAEFNDSSSRDEIQSLSREALECLQLEKLNSLLAQILPHNQFYRDKLRSLSSLNNLQELSDLPFTTKAELLAENGFAKNLTWPTEDYVRFHRTSGTRGNPMAVLDTTEDWQWWMQVWQYVLDTADISSQDRCFLAFSFGPFIGFWSAHDAIVARGAMSIPGGGLSTRSLLPAHLRDHLPRGKYLFGGLLPLPERLLHPVRGGRVQKDHLLSRSPGRAGGLQRHT